MNVQQYPRSRKGTHTLERQRGGTVSNRDKSSVCEAVGQVEEYMRAKALILITVQKIITGNFLECFLWVGY